MHAPQREIRSWGHKLVEEAHRSPGRDSRASTAASRRLGSALSISTNSMSLPAASPLLFTSCQAVQPSRMLLSATFGSAARVENGMCAWKGKSACIRRASTAALFLCCLPMSLMSTWDRMPSAGATWPWDTANCNTGRSVDTHTGRTHGVCSACALLFPSLQPLPLLLRVCCIGPERVHRALVYLHIRNTLPLQQLR